jgi:NDP-sugar pyrophosphorylase family protein
MQAVVLAGGQGTRLAPYTTVLPKPLMPIGDFPILEVVIRQLKRWGFDSIVLTISCHFELFQALFQDGKKWGTRIEYSLEPERRGTAGPLKLVRDLEDDFLVINGDILCDLDYGEFLRSHVREGCLMSVAAKSRALKVDYGVLEMSDKGLLSAFTEKPELQYWVGTGVAAMSKAVVGYIPESQPFDMPDLIHELLRRGLPIRCCPINGYWLDIGRPDDYRTAVEQFPSMKDSLLGDEGKRRT